MIRVIAAICMFLFAIGGAELTRSATEKKVETLMQNLDQIEYNLGDKNDLINAAEELKTNWESAAKTFSCYLDHRHFDKAGESIERLGAYVKYNDFSNSGGSNLNPTGSSHADVMAECENLRFTLGHIRNMSCITPENIV